MLIDAGELGASFQTFATDDAAVLGMVREIRRHIDEGKRDFSKLGAWVDRQLAGVPEKNDLAELGAIFRAAQRDVRFTSDPHKLDTVRAPRLTLERRAGDCDDFSALLGAAAEHIGYPVRLRVCGVQSGKWKHVYPEAWSRRTGRWVAMDASEKGRPLGWRSSWPGGTYVEGSGMIVPDRQIQGLGGFFSDAASFAQRTLIDDQVPPALQPKPEGLSLGQILTAAAVVGVIVALTGGKKKPGR